MVNLKLTSKFFIIILFFSLLVSFLLKSFINNEILSNILVGLNSLLILFYILTSIKNNLAKSLLIIFFLVRLFVLYLDYYGKELVNVLHSGGDSENFYVWGLDISRNLSLLKEISYTKYTDFLGYLYWIIGDQRLLSQFINVILGTWSIFIFFRILDLFNLNDTKKLFFVALYGFFPQNIILSSILLREAFIQFFFIFSVFFFCKWLMKNEKSYMLTTLLFALLSSLFHAGMLVSLLIFGYIFLFFDVKSNSFNYSFKRLTVLFVACGLVVLIIAKDQSLLNGKFSLLQTFGNDISLIDQYQANSVASEKGGSTYLTNFKISSFTDVLLFVPLKFIYFIFSPMPYDIRGLGDLTAILIDSSFYYLLIYKIVRNRKHINKNFYRIIPKIFFALFLLIALGFAFGTENSGTAMRHRTKIFPVLLIAVVIIDSMKGNKNSIWNDKKIIE